MRKFYLIAITLVVILNSLWGTSPPNLSSATDGDYLEASRHENHHQQAILLADIVGATEVCSGEEATYEIAETPEASYIWTISNGMGYSFINPNTISVCWENNSYNNNVETISVEIIDANGTSTTESLEVTVYALPNFEIQYPDICGVIGDRIEEENLEEECPNIVRHSKIDIISIPVNTSKEKHCIITCENTAVTYQATDMTGFQYDWQVVGGTIMGATDEATVTIEWGDTQPASFSLTVTNQQGCSTTEESCISFVPSPSAEISANEVCLGQPTSFSVSNLDANSWTWIFPDGSTSSQIEPEYTFPTGGTHQVCLVLEKSQNYASGRKQETENPAETILVYSCIGCVCTDTIKLDVVVNPAIAPDIECISTVCPSDTVCYSTSADCSNFTWNITGEADILDGGSSSDDFICVIWGDGPEGTISLGVGGCNGTYCTTPTEVNIPILGDEFVIAGEEIVCQGDKYLYTTTKYPGALYEWTATGGTIVGDATSNYVSVIWNQSPPSTGYINVVIDSEFLNPDGSAGTCWGEDKYSVQILPTFVIQSHPDPVCKGVTSTYTANGSANWTIEGGTPQGAINNVSSVDVLWDVASGVYDITAVTTGNFCNDSDHTSVEVVEVLPVDEITGPMEICPTSINTYYAVGVDPDYGLFWEPIGGTVVNSGSNTIDIQWDAVGPYGLSVIQLQTSSPNCKSTPVSLTITPLDFSNLAITGDQSICVNSLASYTITPAIEGEEYEWTIYPETAGNVDPNMQGSSTVDIQWGAIAQQNVLIEVSICGNLAELEVEISDFGPLLEITPGTLCPNGALTLSTNASSADHSFSWVNENDNVISSNPTLDVTTAGYYAVTVINTNSGCLESASICVEDIPEQEYHLSTPDPDMCTDNPFDVTIYAPIADNIATYEWFCNNSQVQGPNSSSTYVHQGSSIAGTWNYQAEIITNDGCIFTSDIITVVHDTCGTNNCQPDPSSVDFSWTTGQYCNKFNFTPTPTINAPHYWWFDNGASSTNPTPTHLFTTVGFHTAVLQVTVPNQNPPPATCLITAFHTDILVPVAANFTFGEVCANTPLSLVSTSQTVDPATSIIDHDWIIDGVEITGANASTYDHTFSAGGDYDVTLIVTTDDGCKAIITQTVHVLPAPAITLPAPVNACVEEIIAFEASSSNSNTTTEIITWNWDFGDGNTSNEESPFYAYTTSGTYDVSLTVTNIFGCETTESMTVTIYESQITTCEISPSGVVNVCTLDLPFTLTAPISDNGVYNWSTGATTPTIQVTTSGAYHVTIYDSNGCSCVSPPVQVSVTPPPPATIKGDLEFCFGESTTLDATANGGVPGLYTYQWNTGSANAIISVANTGTYTVTITNTYNNCSSIASVDVIRHSTPATPVINSVPNPACAGSAIVLSITNVNPTLTYTWSTGEVGTSITVSTEGTYNVTAYTPEGCKSTGSYIVHPLPDICVIPSGCYERCEGDTLCIPAIFASYEWYLDGQAIGNTTNCVVLNTSGVYQVLVSTNIGCTILSEELEVSLSGCEEMSCEDLSIRATETPSTDDYCCYDITINNDVPDWVTSVQFVPLNPGAFEFNNIVNPDNSQWYYTSASDDNIEIISNTGTQDPSCPYRYFPTGVQDVVQFCLKNYNGQPQEVLVNWKNCADIICSDTLIFECNRCVNVTNDSLFCDENGIFKYTFDVQNVFNQELCQLGVNIVEADNPSITVIPDPIVFDPCLQPGETAVGQVFTFENVVPGDIVKIVLESSANLTDEGDFSKSLNACISDTICLVMPECPCHPCDDIVYNFTPIDIGADTCCFSMDFEICTDEYTGVRLTSLDGVFFTNLATEQNSGWYFNNVEPTSTATWYPAPPPPHSTPIEEGAYQGKVQFCLGGYTGANQYPQNIHVEWLSGDDVTVACQDTAQFFCEVPPPDSCIAVSEEMWECLPDGSYNFNFSVANISDFVADQVSIINLHTIVNGTVTELDAIVDASPLGLGDLVDIGPINLPNLSPGDEVCFQVALIENYEMSEYFVRCCHTDTLCFVVPPCETDCEIEVILPDDLEICLGDNYTINPSITGQIGDVTCTWENDPAFINLTDCNPVFSPTEPGVYTLTITVTDENDCMAEDRIIITVLEDCCCAEQEELAALVAQGFSWDTNCEQIKVAPTATLDSACFEVLWSWGDGTSSTTTGNNAIVHVYPASGTSYEVCMVIYAIDENGERCAKEEYCERVEIPSCACDCGKTFELEVGNSFTAIKQKPCEDYGYIFNPNSLNSSCDEVSWSVLQGSNVIHSESGYSINYNFPQSGVYQVCMYVVRTAADGTRCKSRVCKKMKIACIQTFPDIIINPGFDIAVVPGILGNGGQADPWTGNAGTPILIAGSGCENDNYIQLAGNRDRSDVISQPLSDLTENYYKVSFCYRMDNTQSPANAKTKLVLRAANETQTSVRCTADCQQIGSIPLNASNDWLQVSETVTYLRAPQALTHLSLHVTNELADDGTPASWSTVEIDNIIIEPMLNDCDDTELGIMSEEHTLTGLGIYNAKEKVVSDVKTGYGSNIRFTAGESIYLGAGFEIPVGATFTATIEDCEEALAPTNENVEDREADNTAFENNTLLGTVQLIAHPNPFKDNTMISYQLPESGTIQLQVFNINGKVIHTLQESRYQRAGEYKIEFVSKNLAEGLYFVRLQTEQNTMTKKLIITK